MKVIYKLPSRSRPTKLINCIENILLLAQHDNFVILPTVDDNDYTIDQTVRAKLADFGDRVVPVYGRSSSKINAVNRDIPLWEWDIVVATSDDMEFIEPGFDLQIIEHMTQFFPDTDGVLHYPDGYEHAPILSLPILGRKYYDRFGYIYHPSYQSLFCDEEAIEVAERLGKLASINANFFRHKHPSWTGEKMDKQYKYTEGFHAVDKRTFENRKRRNFFV